MDMRVKLMKGQVGRRFHRRGERWSLCVLAVAAGAVFWAAIGAHRSQPPRPPAGAQQPNVIGLTQILSAPPVTLAQYDIALLNLVCAEGLPGAQGLDIAECLATLDRWADRVRAETERHLYRFRRHPEEFDHSEAYFRMLMMAVVLCEDSGIRYNPDRMPVPEVAGSPDGFFTDSRDLFLHGLLTQRRLGTCSSMPVLYAAIGRRLGYPLKLSTTKAHVFLRWDSPTERLNLEATGRGMNHYDDDHYKEWPFPVTDGEVVAEGYLQSLSAAQELALFLSLRGNCLRATGRLNEAVTAYAQAVRVAPEARACRALLADAQAAATPLTAVLARRPLRPAWAGGGFQPAGPPDPNPLRAVR